MAKRVRIRAFSSPRLTQHPSRFPCIPRRTLSITLLSLAHEFCLLSRLPFHAPQIRYSAFFLAFFSRHALSSFTPFIHLSITLSTPPTPRTLPFDVYSFRACFYAQNTAPPLLATPSGSSSIRSPPSHHCCTARKFQYHDLAYTGEFCFTAHGSCRGEELFPR